MQSSKIIIRMPNWLGDSVMALPVLKKLNVRWPQASLSVCIPAGQSPIFEALPHVDKIFAHEKAIHKSLRKEAFDIGLLLTNSFSSAWSFWRSSIKYRVGFRNEGRSFLLSRALKKPQNTETRHLVEVYQELLDVFDCPQEPFSPQIDVPQAALDSMADFLEKEGLSKRQIISVHPAAAYGPAKCWLQDRVIALSEKLLEDENICIVYVGDQKAKPYIDALCQASHSQRIFNFAGKTSLLELMALFKHSCLVLSNDSGPMHLADAVGSKVLALFGSTNPLKTRPYNGGHVMYKKASCSPCYLRECPIDFRCMKAIEVDEVFEQIQIMRSH